MQYARIAHIAHEVNRVYCQSIGDNSQPKWDDAPTWQKDSAVNGVVYLAQNPDATPKLSHENWFNMKLREGWKYGEEKDAEKKTHPCMSPYDALPEKQKFKDFFFHAVVRAALG